jgi:hypothetical protein
MNRRHAIRPAPNFLKRCPAPMIEPDRSVDPRASDLTPAPSAIIALIAEVEFARARSFIPDLRLHRDYADWRDSREAVQVGLAMAGVDAKLALVALTPFLAWRRLTGTPASEGGLDFFASKLLAFRTPPEPIVFGMVDELDFATHSPAIRSLLQADDHGQWRRGREAIRRELALSGRRVEELPIRLDNFILWRACVGDAPSSSIDRYAHLLLEHFAFDVKDQGPGRR